MKTLKRRTALIAHVRRTIFAQSTTSLCSKSQHRNNPYFYSQNFGETATLYRLIQAVRCHYFGSYQIIKSSVYHSLQ
jgi:hypothetical protein